MTSFHDRRTFIAALPSLAGLATLGAGSTLAIAASAAGEPAARRNSEWDLSFLDTLHGRHKQVFSFGSLKGHTPLHVVTNYLDAHLEVFRLRYPDVNTVVGINGGAFPINANDALWVKYELGRRWEIKDPATDEWARRNVFLDPMPAPPGKVVGVRALMARGTIFWQCNNSLTGVVAMLVRDLGRPAEEIRDELLAGLNPGVHLVPAHTMALGLCQERGCTYEQIG